LMSPAGFEPTIPLYERGVIANLTMGRHNN
jgi:hypothetical protein